MNDFKQKIIEKLYNRKPKKKDVEFFVFTIPIKAIPIMS